VYTNDKKNEKEIFHFNGNYRDEETNHQLHALFVSTTKNSGRDVIKELGKKYNLREQFQTFLIFCSHCEGNHRPP
jgi:hypothetical protein